MAFSTVIRRAASPSLFRPSSPALSSAFRRSPAVHLSPLSSLLRSPPPASAAHLSPSPASAVHLSRFSSSLLRSPPPAPAAVRLSSFSTEAEAGEHGDPVTCFRRIMPIIIVPAPLAAPAASFYARALGLDVVDTSTLSVIPPLAEITLSSSTVDGFFTCIVVDSPDLLPASGSMGLFELRLLDVKAVEAAANRLVSGGGVMVKTPGDPIGYRVVRDPFRYTWRIMAFRT